MPQRGVRVPLVCAAVLGLAGAVLGIAARAPGVIMIGAAVIVSAFALWTLIGRPLSRRIR